MIDIVERLRELDKKGYQPLTGAIGEEAAKDIERLRELLSEFVALCTTEDIITKAYGWGDLITRARIKLDLGRPVKPHRSGGGHWVVK